MGKACGAVHRRGGRGGRGSRRRGRGRLRGGGRGGFRRGRRLRGGGRFGFRGRRCLLLRGGGRRGLAVTTGRGGTTFDVLVYPHDALVIVGMVDDTGGNSQRHDGIRCTGQPDSHAVGSGIAVIALGTGQVLGAVFVNGQVRGLGAVRQQQMAAAAQLGGVCSGLAGLGLGALSVGDGVGHLLDDGGSACVFAGRVLSALVDLAGLDDLLFHGGHISLIDDLLVDGYSLAFGRDIPLDGLHSHGVVARLHLLGQGRAGLGVQLVIGGLAVLVSQGHGGGHIQQGQLFLGVLILVGGTFGGGSRQRIKLHTNVLLHDGHIDVQVLIRFRRSRRFRGRGGGRLHDGRRLRGGFRLGLGREGRCHDAQADAGREYHGRAACHQFVQRQTRKGVAGEIFHGIPLTEHPVLTVSFYRVLLLLMVIIP